MPYKGSHVPLAAGHTYDHHASRASRDHLCHACGGACDPCHGHGHLSSVVVLEWGTCGGRLSSVAAAVRSGTQTPLPTQQGSLRKIAQPTCC